VNELDSSVIIQHLDLFPGCRVVESVSESSTGSSRLYINYNVHAFAGNGFWMYVSGSLSSCMPYGTCFYVRVQCNEGRGCQKGIRVVRTV
jgi:hypothetical protein